MHSIELLANWSIALATVCVVLWMLTPEGQ